LRRRLRREEGSVLLIALIVLSIAGVLAATTVAVSVQTNHSTRRDANYKNALEAAEGGLQVALYRLNMMRPDDQYCVGDVVASPNGTGTCASSSYALGNGTTYRYYTTPALSGTATCVGATLASTSYIAQRCITAVGTANGITARSQIRAAAFGAEPLFPYGGITGVNGITNGNNATINGSEASNRTITAGSNTVITGGVVLGPGASFSGSGSPVQHTLPSPIVVDPVDPGSSNQTLLAACPARQAAGYPSCNDDYRITDGINDPSGNTKPYDQSSGFSFNASTRTLTTSNSHPSITLGGGLYNFCEVDILNNATISLAVGVKAEIIIDSPDDPGSGCATGTGNLNIKNNVTWSNPANDPTALQIYVYGASNGTNTVNFKNNGGCECVLYAPQSTVTLSHNSNGSDLNGAVLGQTVIVPNNFNFTFNGLAGTIQARSTGVYFRSAWAQCIPESNPSTPGSGCG
jgi:Tfp pilus assembly protein PilX